MKVTVNIVDGESKVGILQFWTTLDKLTISLIKEEYGKEADKYGKSKEVAFFVKDFALKEMCIDNFKKNVLKEENQIFKVLVFGANWKHCDFIIKKRKRDKKDEEDEDESPKKKHKSSHKQNLFDNKNKTDNKK